MLRALKCVKYLMISGLTFDLLLEKKNTNKMHMLYSKVKVFCI